MNLIRDNVKIELEDLGEGLMGEFDENDPNDVPLLRFTIAVKGKLAEFYQRQYGYLDGEMGWVDLPDASYCTNLSATASEQEQQSFLEKLMDELYTLVCVDRYKRRAQQLTHMGA